MPKNNLDQAPKIRSVGNKTPQELNVGRTAWGKAIRPHELETIFNNCIDARSFVQYKIMMFLTGNAEEKFDVSLENIMTRCNISKTAYYDNRTKLIKRGWLSMEDDGNRSYIVIHYDKIYEDGKEYIGIKKEEGTSKNNSDESTSENNPHNKKEGYIDKYTDESMSQFTTEEGMSQFTTEKEGMSENTTLYESTSEFTPESTSEFTPESTSHWSQYSIKNNKKINNIGTVSEEKREEFEKVWNTRLTGAARLF